MRLGQKAMEALRAEITGSLRIGDELVVAGDIALAGTALLACREREYLRQFFSEGFLWDAERGLELHSVYRKGNARSLEYAEQSGAGERPAETAEGTSVWQCAVKSDGTEKYMAESSVAREYPAETVEETAVWKYAAGHGASALYGLGCGGVLAGLWKMAEAAQVGLGIDLRAIPIRQETIEICERFDLDPYKLLSDGAILIGTPDAAELLHFCREQEIPAAVIGRAVKGNDRLLSSGGLIRFLDRPAPDEIVKLPWGEQFLERR